MQNDYRSYYSEDRLKAISDNFENLPDLDSLKTARQFWSGSPEKVMLNYMTAKYQVKNWYSKLKLDNLINDLNSGESFEKAYDQ